MEHFRDPDTQAKIIDRSPVGIAIAAPDGKFTSVNHAYCEIVGYSEHEMLSKNWQEITHPDDLQADRVEAANLAANPSSGGYSMVKRYLRKDSRIVWVEIYVSANRNSGGGFSSYLVFAVPLPSAGGYKLESTSSGVTLRPSTRWLDLVCDNPRESLFVFVTLGGFFKIIDGSILELAKALFSSWHK